MKYITNLSDFYKSKEWEAFRKQVIHDRLNEFGETIDEVTGKPIYKEYDIILHHKIELTLENVNDVSISLNPENIMIVSFKTHNEIHRRFGNYKKKVILVHGSPCSGKSTWVENVATKDDIILDMDKIWQMISINPKYIKPNRLKEPVFALRESMMDIIKMRSGMWFNAYVIVTMPRYMERKRLIDRLGVDEVIHIKEDMRVCLERLYDNPNGRNKEEYEKYIKDYFTSYQEE